MIFNAFYGFYEFSKVLSQHNVGLTAGGYLLFMIISVVLEIAGFAVYYTFRSIGLYKMAKNARLDKPMRAIIPFYGIHYCSKLAPNSKYVKKYPSIYILAIIFGALYLLALVLLDAIYGIPAIVKLVEFNSINGANAPVPTTAISTIFGFGRFFAGILTAYGSLCSLAYAVFLFMVYRNVFMSYTTTNVNNYLLFTALGYVFLDTFLLAGIFIFVLRNKPRINYDAYYEARRQWAQSYNQRNNPYGGNPYGGNPYGRNNGYYGQNPSNNQPQQRDIDPFEEFSNSRNSGQSAKTNDNDGEDDFFN